MDSVNPLRLVGTLDLPIRSPASVFDVLLTRSLARPIEPNRNISEFVNNNLLLSLDLARHIWRFVYQACWTRCSDVVLS